MFETNLYKNVPRNSDRFCTKNIPQFPEFRDQKPQKDTLEAGRRAIGLDIDIGGDSMNMASDMGFSNCLYQVANMEEGGGGLMAPVCGSWVFMWLGSQKD